MKRLKRLTKLAKQYAELEGDILKQRGKMASVELALYQTKLDLASELQDTKLTIDGREYKRGPNGELLIRRIKDSNVSIKCT